jgi:hypothetical protein
MIPGRSGHQVRMASLTASSPPAVTEICSWALATPAELSRLRAALYEALTGEPFLREAQLDDVPEKMVLVATELATNALRHGLPPTVVRLGRAEDGDFVLDVSDQDPQIIPEFAEARPAGAGGLGLQVARTLALDIGWYLVDGTKHVWAMFPAKG